jgi:hypothetical protein
MIPKAVLGMLLERDGWDRYGQQFRRGYWDGRTGGDLYDIIARFWESAGDRIKTLDDATISALIHANHDAAEAAERLRYVRDAKKIPDGKRDPLVHEALRLWASRDALISLADDHAAGNFDAAAGALRLDELARAQNNGHTGPILSQPHLDVLDTVTSEKSTQVYPTGIPQIDEQLTGGLWSGETGIVLAPSHRGKTQFLVGMGAAALLDGIPIQHHTCEISAKRTKIRYYQCLCKLQRALVLGSPSLARRRLAKLHLPPWSIRDWSGAKASTAQVRQDVMRFIEACDRAGIKKRPLILVDYIDLLYPAQGGNEGRFALNAIIKELRHIAVSYDVGLWTASQTQRSTYGDKASVRMQHAAESIGKIENADVILTLNANALEKNIGVQRWYIDKARERTVTIPETAVRNRKELQWFDPNLTDVEEIYYGGDDGAR